jgi:hypothetical protein
MYPEQPTQTTPIDYLNQIAPQAPKKPRFNPLRLGLITIAGIVLLIIVTAIVSSVTKGSTTQLEQLAARLQTTATIASSAQNTIKDSNLQSENVTLQLYLTNTNRSIAAPLAAVGVNTANIDPKIIADESGTAITNRLTDASLNAVFDNTYASEMSYQLTTIIILMKQIYNTEGNSAVKAFLNTASSNLTPIQKQFSNFNSTDS